jgi:hypothetical protein
MEKSEIVVGTSALMFHCPSIDQGKSLSEYPTIAWRMIRYADRERARHDDKGKTE